MTICRAIRRARSNVSNSNSNHRIKEIIVSVTIAALKELMLATGLDAELVRRLDPDRPLIQQGVD